MDLFEITPDVVLISSDDVTSVDSTLDDCRVKRVKISLLDTSGVTLPPDKLLF